MSTMEAEYVALSTSCRELVPIVDLEKELGAATKLPIKDDTSMHISIHEDNSGALVLGKLELPIMTPRSKHYADKYHWFRRRVNREGSGIKLLKIDTKDQLGNIFTKSLPRATFEFLRKKQMGW